MLLLTAGRYTPRRISARQQRYDFQGMVMSDMPAWMQISFSRTETDATIPQQLVQILCSAYRSRPRPAEPVVFRTTGLSGVYDYFLTPEASLLVHDALLALGARKCALPDISCLVPVLLPITPR